MKFRTILLFFVTFTIFVSSVGKKGGSINRGGNNASPVGSNTGARPGTNPGSGSFNSKSGGSIGSSAGSGKAFSSGSTSKIVAAGIAGAAVGIGGYALINAASGHYSYNQRTYYMGDRYYPSSTSSSKIVCRYTILDDDPNFKNLRYNDTDKTKVKEIIYECNKNSERCCDLDCCKDNQKTQTVYYERKRLPWWGSLLIFILLAGLFGIIGYCIYMRIKRRKLYNQSHPDATYVVAQEQPQDPHGYPQQQFAQVPPAYPQTSYPTAGGYPQQQPYPQAYPPQQTYGQNVPQNYPQYPGAQPNYGQQTNPGQYPPPAYPQQYPQQSNVQYSKN